MELERYFFYLIVSSITIASPGPGVVFSLTNSIKHGFTYSIPGFMGLATGTLLVSLLAGSGLGTVLMSYDHAFMMLKYVGALYLLYLGFKLWREDSIGTNKNEISEGEDSLYIRFRSGLFITLSNPKLIVFFIALFPQFIDVKSDYIGQVTTLSLTFCSLLILIHFTYCAFASRIRNWFFKTDGPKFINKASAVCFFCFAAGLIMAE